MAYKIALKMAFTVSGQNYGSSRHLQLLHNQSSGAGCYGVRTLGARNIERSKAYACLKA